MTSCKRNVVYTTARHYGAKRVLKKASPAAFGVLGFFASSFFLRSCLTATIVSDVCTVIGSQNKLTKFLSTESLSVWVQSEEDSLVDERVLLLGPWTFLVLLVGGPDDGLDFVAVDQTGDVWVGDFGRWQASRQTQQIITLRSTYAPKTTYR